MLTLEVIKASRVEEIFAIKTAFNWTGRSNGSWSLSDIIPWIEDAYTAKQPPEAMTIDHQQTTVPILCLRQGQMSATLVFRKRSSELYLEFHGKTRSFTQAWKSKVIEEQTARIEAIFKDNPNLFQLLPHSLVTWGQFYYKVLGEWQPISYFDINEVEISLSRQFISSLDGELNNRGKSQNDWYTLCIAANYLKKLGIVDSKIWVNKMPLAHPELLFKDAFGRYAKMNFDTLTIEAGIFEPFQRINSKSVPNLMSKFYELITDVNAIPIAVMRKLPDYEEQFSVVDAEGRKFKMTRDGKYSFALTDQEGITTSHQQHRLKYYVNTTRV